MIKLSGKRSFFIYYLILLSLAVIFSGAFCHFYGEVFAETCDNETIVLKTDEREIADGKSNGLNCNNFEDLLSALENADSGDVIEYYGELEKSFTVNKGVTLVLVKPSDFTDEDFTALKLSESATITVDGSLVVGRKEDILSPFAEEFSENFAEINGKIIVNGNMTVNLPIGGSGEVMVNGNLESLLYITDFVSKQVFETLYNESKPPFNEYAVLLRCKTTLNHNASANLDVYSEKEFLCKVNLIGQDEDCFLNLQSGGKVQILYDENVCIKEDVGSRNLKNFGKTTVNIYGDAKINAFTMIFDDSRITFSNVPFAIPYNVDVILKDGVVVLSDKASIKVLPGGSLYLEKDSTLKVFGGLSVYDGFVFLENEGMVYPNHDYLYRYGFSKCGNLFVDGRLTVSGTFTGTAQCNNLGGVIEVLDGAVLDETLSEGSLAFSVANFSEVYQCAKVASLNDFVKLKSGKTYKSVAISPKTLDFITVNKGVDGLNETTFYDKKVYLYQDFYGRFFESDGENYCLNIDIFIGETVKNVCVNVNGKNYYTNNDGIINVEVGVEKDDFKIDYYSPLFEDGNFLRTYNLEYDEAVILTEVVKGVSLSDVNDYDISYDKSIQRYYADIDFYGGKSFRCEVFPAITFADCYVKETEFLLQGFKSSDDLIHDLYFYKEELDEYKNVVNGLIDGFLTKERVENAYFLYLNLINGLSQKELNYLSVVLDGFCDFEYAVDFTSDGLTYGDIESSATLTFVDGSQKTESVKVVNYDYLNGDIVATALYEGAYKNIEYSIEKKIYNVSPAEIVYLVENKTSVYLEEILPLTGRIGEGELKFSDNIDDVVRLYTSAKLGSAVGNYYVTGKCISPFYNVKFANGTYKITKRTVSISVDEKTVKFSESKNIDFKVDTDFATSVVGFEVYQNGEKVAIIDLYGNLSEDLAIGEYEILPVIDEKNFDCLNLERSCLKIVSDSENYAVAFGFLNGYRKEYDGEEFTYSITVTDLKRKTAVEDKNVEVAVYKDGILADKILSVGSYTVEVKVFAETFTANLTIEKRRLNVSVENFDIYYGDDLPEIEFTVDYLSLPEKTIDFRLSDGELICQSVNENFIVESLSGRVSVLPRPITVTCLGGYKYYGDLDGQIYCQLSQGSLIDGDSLGKILALKRAEGESVGEYDIYIDEESVDKEKYAVTFISEKFYVYPRKISVSICDVKAVYGEPFSLTASVVVGELAFSEELNSVVKLFIDNEEYPVGVYEIDYEIINDNYSVTVFGGSLRILPKKITVTVLDQEKTYGDSDNLVAVCDDGNISASDLAKIISVDRASGETVGEYEITVRSIDENYDVDVDYSRSGFSLFTIKPKVIDVKINDLTVDFTESYDGIISKITFAYSEGEIVFGEDFKINYEIKSDGSIFKKEDFDLSHTIGSYEIIGNIENNNYLATIKSGTLNVDKKLIEVLDMKTECVYSGKVLLPFDYRRDIVNGELYGETDFIVSYEIKDDEGAYYYIDKIQNAGEYLVTVKIKEEDKYKFASGSKFTFCFVVSKLDVTKNLSLTIEGDYIVIGKNRPIARLFDYNADLKQELFYGEEKVDDIEKEGEYLIKITVNDNNLSGKTEAVFYAYKDVSEKIAKISDLLQQEKLNEKVKASNFFTIKKIIADLSYGDLLQINDNSTYKTVIDDFLKEYSAFLEEKNDNFEIVQALYNPSADIISAVSFSAVLSLFIKMIAKRRLK